MNEISTPHTINSSITNVAQVPHRSPLRYPGGKTWLIPHIRQWFSSLPQKPNLLLEPFAGGGIVSLTVAFEQLAESVLMIELDDQVAAVWHTLLSEGEWLANRIVNFELTHDNVSSALAQEPLSRRDKAFKTVLRSRINRGGILAPGAGMLKYGEKGRGIHSRWYPETLQRRILDIIAIQERIQFVEGDGLQVLERHSQRHDVVYFIDPPYTAAGKKAGARLYKCSHLDHERLFEAVSTLVGDFLMTYDHSSEIADLAKSYSFDTMSVAMKNVHNTRMNELLISRNLDWARV
jgi:DNA adenine methylase